MLISAPGDASTSPGFGVFLSRSSLVADTDELEANALRTLKGSKPSTQKLPRVKFGGVTFYHLRAKEGVQMYDQYGALVDSMEPSVAWTFNSMLVDRQTADRLINQVMPTFEYDG